MHSLGLTSGVTPADFLVVSMAPKPFSSDICEQTLVGLVTGIYCATTSYYESKRMLYQLIYFTLAIGSTILPLHLVPFQGLMQLHTPNLPLLY